jgi:hypothetical protein
MTITVIVLTIIFKIIEEYRVGYRGHYQETIGHICRATICAKTSYSRNTRYDDNRMQKIEGDLTEIITEVMIIIMEKQTR